MACMGIACVSGGGKGGGLSFKRGDVGVSLSPLHRNVQSASLLPVRTPRSGNRLLGKRISMSAASTASPETKLDGIGDNANGKSSSLTTREKVDEWLRDSVAEIVMNLKDSPLMVQVYAENDGAVRRTTETAADWPMMKQRWEKGEAQLPEGVIFVEQLENENVGKVAEMTEDQESADGGWRGGGTRAWGIVAQCRGADCGPVCYLLKTNSNPGPGMWCTHFCLINVKSFRETSKSQLINCWLPQSGQ